MSVSLSEALQTYYPKWSPECGDVTRERYRYDVQRWCIVIGDVPIEEITTEHFREFREKAADRYARRSINTTTRTIRQILKAAVSCGALESMPDTGRQLRLRAPEPNVPTLDDLELLYQHAGAYGWPNQRTMGLEPAVWWRAWMCLAVWTGLRRSDLFWGLHWRHVCFESQTLSYRASKTGTRHVFPLSRVVLHHLSWLRTLGCRPDESVFRTPKSIRDIRHGLRAISRAADVPDVTPQHFRRAAIMVWSKADSQAGHLVHGCGMPRILLHYVDPCEILRNAADRVVLPPSMRELRFKPRFRAGGQVS